MPRPSANEQYTHKVNKDGNIQYSVTVPEALGRRLEQEASAERRTASNLIHHILGLYFEALDG